MTKTNYGYRKEIDGTFPQVVEKIRKSLSNNNFGIISEIDVSAKLNEKLNEDFPQYLILGACNPKLALEALNIEKEIGLLFPCNVIIYKESDKIFVSAVMPTATMSFVENEKLMDVFKRAELVLKSAIDECK